MIGYSIIKLSALRCFIIFILCACILSIFLKFLFIEDMSFQIITESFILPLCVGAFLTCRSGINDLKKFQENE